MNICPCVLEKCENVLELFLNCSGFFSKILLATLYWCSYFDESKNDMKKTWKGIRQLVNIKNPLAHQVYQLDC